MSANAGGVANHLSIHSSGSKRQADRPINTPNAWSGSTTEDAFARAATAASQRHVLFRTASKVVLAVCVRAEYLLFVVLCVHGKQLGEWYAC